MIRALMFPVPLAPLPQCLPEANLPGCAGPDAGHRLRGWGTGRGEMVLICTILISPHEWKKVLDVSFKQTVSNV